MNITAGGKMIRVAAIALGTLLASSAIASDIPEPGSIPHPYYSCMLQQASKYAKKSRETQDAIDGAKAACASKRDAMIKVLSRELILQMPQDMADQMASEIADDWDAKFRPQYVRAVLDAR